MYRSPPVTECAARLPARPVVLSGGGSLAYKEMRRILSGTAPPAKKKMVLSGEGSMGDQLAEALRSNSARVLDLFRSWDTNGDGEVSRAEFHKAVPALGLDVPKKDVDDLFNSWDKDGGGSLAYKELKKILSAKPGSTPEPSPVPGKTTLQAAGKLAALSGKAKKGT